MTFDTAFRLSSYSLILTSVFSLFAAGGLNGFLGVMYLVLLGTSWRLNPLKSASWQQVVLVLAAVFIAVLDTVLLRYPTGAVVRLLLGLSLIKTYSRGSDRDYLQVYLIALALLLVAATFPPTIYFLVSLVVFFFFTILSLILFENRAAYRTDPLSRFPLASYLTAAMGITALVVILAIPIFVAIPRGSLGVTQGENMSLSGFSESVRLGEMGQILSNPRVVMRVRVNAGPEDLPYHLKWRGIALDQFDGSVWRNSRVAVQEITGDSEGRFPLGPGRRYDEKLLEQSFLVEPFSSVVFVSPEAIQFSGVQQRRSKIWQDGNQTIYLSPRPSKPFRYFIHSDLRSREQRISQIVSSQEDIPERYLRLPKLDHRIAELAGRLTRDLDSSLEKAVRMSK